MARRTGGRRAYATDLTDGQWALIAPLIPEAEPGGRPRKAPARDLVDAIFSARRDGVASAAARPAALADGLLLSAPLAARGRLGSGPSRARHGRPRARRPRGQPDCRHHRQPIGQDGRSKGGSKGYDAGKKINGRKRHILTDTDGRLLTVKVHSASIQDRDGGKTVLKASRARYPFVTRAFADGGYAGRLVRWAKDKAHIVVEVVKRSPAAKGFEVLRRRWVVERTFAWIVKNRRFVRDYEQLTAVAETLIIVAATATLIRRWP